MDTTVSWNKKELELEKDTCGSDDTAIYNGCEKTSKIAIDRAGITSKKLI